jgi:hypothetical protein
MEIRKKGYSTIGVALSSVGRRLTMLVKLLD